MLFIAQAGFSQFSTTLVDLQYLLLAKDDASLLLENYTTPVFEGLNNNINGGWYTSAKTHRLLGFDVTLSVNYALIPAEEKTFTFDSDDYKFLSTPSATGTEELPTVFGKKDTPTTLTVEIPFNGNVKKADFEVPAYGIDLGGFNQYEKYLGVPLPMLQVGVGLPLRTDLKFRYLPTMNVVDENFSYNVFGVGIQHDLLQYFRPSGRKIFNLAALAAMTNVDVKYNLVNSQNLQGVNLNSDGSVGFNMNAWTAQIIGSLDLAYILTVYGSIGYNTASSSVYMKGKYGLEYDVVEPNTGIVIAKVIDEVEDPINLKFGSQHFRSTIGTRLNLGFFKIFADYTFQQYNVITAGTAFSFEWPKFAGEKSKRKPRKRASNQAVEKETNTIEERVISPSEDIIEDDSNEGDDNYEEENETDEEEVTPEIIEDDNQEEVAPEVIEDENDEDEDDDNEDEDEDDEDDE